MVFMVEPLLISISFLPLLPVFERRAGSPRHA
jgi:hypothetical protein